MHLRLLSRAALLAAVPVAACTTWPRARAPQADAPAIPARRAPAFPADFRFRPGAIEAEFAPRAMISSNSDLASQAGVEILRRGGNAVDAAVATGFALAVVYPEAGNLGGGGFMVMRFADGRTAALDYREVAPASATRDMFLDSAGNVTSASVEGYLASGVPSAVAGMAAALARYGTMSLAEVLAPAIHLADAGFVVDADLHRSIANNRERIAKFAGRAVFLPGGEPPAVGSVLRQPVLARTLRLLAVRGADDFYRGEIADSIAAEMARGGGNITRADLEAYEARWREPLHGTYEGYSLIGMPPASSGGTTAILTLNILEALDPLPPFGTAAYWHRLASAFQLAFLDRNTKLGDPDFVNPPVAELTSKPYAARLAAGIDTTRHTPTMTLPAARALVEGNHTTHYSVVDAAGNAVATTTTLNDLYGSGVFIPGAGFFMNDVMDDFAARPGKPNMFGLVEGEQNAIAPGKRMLSAMSPTIVLDPAGQLLLVVGGRGGPRIITSTAQVILNVIEHHMSLADAMAAPRIHMQALPDQLHHERAGLDEPTRRTLEAMGWTLREGGATASIMAIMRAPGGWVGMVEPRSHGGVEGY